MKGDKNMRNIHEFKVDILVACPYESCGKYFNTKRTIQYVTNQRGDVIEQKVL